jgi:diphthamide synthase (EF-2-diphthine--ammonia ligase)
MEIASLLNMISEDGTRSRSHGLPPLLLEMQAEAMGLPLMQRRATWAGYEDEFSKALLLLREQE